jgi:hypothetical protein
MADPGAYGGPAGAGRGVCAAGVRRAGSDAQVAAARGVTAGCRRGRESAGGGGG